MGESWEKRIEKVKIMLVVFGDGVVTSSNIFLCYGMFRDCREHVEDKSRVDRTSTKFLRLWQIKIDNRHLSLKMIAEELSSAMIS